MDDFKISIQQIEIFLTVAKCKSISAAAQKLYLSQPAVSKLMHEMEWILGKQLFVRSNRGITLSPDGELIYARLHNTYHKFRVTLEHIMLEDSPYKNINMLNVGCLNDPGAISSMYAFVNLLKKRQPELQTASEIYSFQELKEKLLFGELDMFFSFSGNEDSEDFESFQLYDVERLFWLPAEWPTPLEKP
ncbi:MAG: LysR family transcriptional regulator, partial [Clostridiales Family XIII bacterium]|nr:LysR family transcriptional regulator [Clostridiales Family XIII bacterium]